MLSKEGRRGVRPQSGLYGLIGVLVGLRSGGVDMAYFDLDAALSVNDCGNIFAVIVVG